LSLHTECGVVALGLPLLITYVWMPTAPPIILKENSSTGFDVCQDRIIFPTQRLAFNINIGGILV
ncbi:MAG: hypothetical protein QGG39_18915, partial [Candidatus Poribacteria bacterium]|nr:hypothetical protein [Candidatus Poribacteria bacterium]